MFLILVVLGLVCFVDGLFNKHNLYDDLGLWAGRQGSKFLYKAGNCKFCLSFYFSVILTLIVSLWMGWQLNSIAVPFVVTGLFNLIKRK